jgi:hypothetical protein
VSARILSILLLIILVISCKKDHRVLDASVLPESDGRRTAYYPGLEVSGYSTGPSVIASYSDRIRFIGNNNEPDFGNIDVGLNTTVSLPGSNLTFTAYTSEGAHLVFPVDTILIKGARNAPLTYTVFAVETALSPEQVYLTDNHYLHSSRVLAVSTLTPGNGGLIKIFLDQPYVDELFHDNANLTTNVLFQAKYKGFYIAASADTSGGAIFRCDLDDPRAGLVLYYRQDTTHNRQDTTHYFLRFPFGGEGAARFNTVAYNPANANASLKAQLSGDTIAGGSRLFVHGLGICNSVIHIPFLTQRDTFRVAVNRAEVVFNVDFGLTGRLGYLWPPKLSLLPLNAAGKDTFAIDQSNATDNARYDGYFVQGTKPGSGRYVFNIARHAQAIFDGKTRNRGFRLVVADPDRLQTARRDNYDERAVLYGADTPLRPVLNLSVVRLDK